MNQKIILGIVAVIIIIAGGGFYFSSSSKTQLENNEAMQTEGSALDQEKDKAAMVEENSMTDKGETMVKADTAMMSKAGSYESYEAGKIAMASDTHDVVLFFRASWCPTCKTVDADIKAHLNEIPASLTILDVNYDNSTELKKKYGVTYQHTFVQVDSNGTLIKKWSGGQTLASILSQLK